MGVRCGERLTVIEPVPEAVKAMLDEVFGGAEIEPGIDCEHPISQCDVQRGLGHEHSWMMLSKRMTLKRRLETAAAAIVARMMMRSMPRVFRPVAPSKKLVSAAAAMVELWVEEAKAIEGQWC